MTAAYDFKPLVFICGKTASGKTELCRVLERNYGVTAAHTHTTRPRRTHDEDGHIYVTEEEAAAISPDDIVEEAVIHENRYFTTRQQLLANDVVVWDVPTVMRFLDTVNAPNDDNCRISGLVVYMSADDDARRDAFLARDENATADAFDARELRDAEDVATLENICLAQTCDPEENSLGELPRHAFALMHIENDYDPDTLDDAARAIVHWLDIRSQVYVMVRDLSEAGIIGAIADGEISRDADESQIFGTSNLAEFIEGAIGDDRMLAFLFRQHLAFCGARIAYKAPVSTSTPFESEDTSDE